MIECPICRKGVKCFASHIVKKTDQDHKLYLDRLIKLVDDLLLNTDLYLNEIVDFIFTNHQMYCWDGLVHTRQLKICPARGYEVLSSRRLGDRNPAKRKKVREKISNTVAHLWERGDYDHRKNGMTDKFKDENPKFNLYKNLRHRYREIYQKYHGIIKCEICDKQSPDDVINIHHIDENHDNFLLTNLQAFCVYHHSDRHYGARKTPYVKVTKNFTFDSCHNLLDYAGKCRHLHGHTYKLEITVKNRIDLYTGMVIDFGDLKTMTESFIINRLDHAYLNDKIPMLNPTAENMLFWMWEQLERGALLKGLWKIRLWETPTSFAEVIQEDMFLSPIYSSSYYDDLEYQA